MGKKYFYAFVLLASLLISPQILAQQYCVPSFGNGCSMGDYVDDFSIKDEAGKTILDHLGTGCSSNGYGDFTSRPALQIDLEADSNYTFEITHGEGSQVVQIWIDLDGNGSFEDAGEMLFKSANPTHSDTKGTLVIPELQGTISTRMRVKTFYSFGYEESNSCTQEGQYGEVHDYKIVITGEDPNCLSPSDIEMEVVSDAAKFSWTDVSTAQDGYSWYVMNEGENPENDMPVDSGFLSTGTSSVTINTLQENINYDFYLRSDCTADFSSIWRVLPVFLAGEGASCDNPIKVDAFPYSHSDNTANFLNIYSGTPGTECGVEQPYLNGNEVVYSFEADTDNMIQLELTDLSQYYAGIFVYESCEDIGNKCAAAAVAGPSTKDLVINEFPVVQGQTYYIVVSTWLTSETDYTLNINEFNCSALESPEGENMQEFTAGNTLEHLEVEKTRASGELKWYLNSGLTDEITDLSAVELTDGTKYYVTQTVNECESPALEITAKEFDCSVLSITSFMDAEVACRGSVTLMAEASGNGHEIFWYDAEENGNLVGRGNAFTTPEITTTTSYWTTEVYGENLEPIKGLGKIKPSTAYELPSSNHGLIFDAFEEFSIIEVDVYPTGSGGEVTIELFDMMNNKLESTKAMVPSGSATEPHTVQLNFRVPGAGKYQLKKMSSGVPLVADHSGNNFKYPLSDVGEITMGTGNNLQQQNLYYFFNWTIVTGDAICNSPMQEVIAEVDQSGDINLTHMDLPFVDVNETVLFGNNYSGNAGDGCAGSDYLNGYETMYSYTADPDKDDILQIELTEFDNSYAAIFIYDSCGSIGIDCIKGATIKDGKIRIKDYYVEAGEELILLVSTSSGKLDYTLNIEGVACDDVSAPVSDETPLFAVGQTITALNLEGSIFNEEFKWYEDGALSNEITDPTTEELKDGKSIFVTQTILGCESHALEITPIEFDCNTMGVNVLVQEAYVCAPGGLVDLHSEASGLGNEVIWYDAETDGNIVGRGESIQTYVSSSRSFWVTEAFANKTSGSNEDLSEMCIPQFALGCSYGDTIEDFVLADTNGNTLIEHLNTGCSVKGYGDYTSSNSLTTELFGGMTYDFEVTHGQSNQFIRIWIDYNGDGSFTNNTELVFEATSAGTSTKSTKASFTIPNDVSSRDAVLRVMTTNGKGIGNSCDSSGSFGEVHDYKVTLSGSKVICESPRKEVIAYVNEEITPAPIVTPKQAICGGGILSELTVLGTDVKWYNSLKNQINSNSPIVEGDTYYVTQTIHGCESEMTKVIMDFSEKSELVVAAVNQAFELGDDLTSLEVYGDNLKWYVDQFKSKELPLDTELVDQETYYVTQVQEGMCESEPIGITVHRVLDIKDVLFDQFSFYPNPVDNVLFITNAFVIEEVEIFDLSGKRVFTNRYHNESIELNISDLATGTYLLKAKIDTTEKIFRIVKK